MTTSPPAIFDRALTKRRLARALATGPAGFLLEHAIADLELRLGLIKRDFGVILDLGTPSPDLAAKLAGGDAQVVRLAPLADMIGGAPLLALVGDEEALPFAPERFDLAVSALALQQVNDLPGTLVQVRRALKPDGLFLGCLLGGQSLNELRTALASPRRSFMAGSAPKSRLSPMSATWALCCKGRASPCPWPIASR